MSIGPSRETLWNLNENILMTFIKANALKNVVWKLLSILFNIPWFTQASYSWRHYMEASLGYAGHVGLMVSCLLDNMFGHVMTLGNPGGEAPGKVNAPCWGTIRPVILSHYQRYDLPHREENDRSTICFRYFMDNFPQKTPESVNFIQQKLPQISHWW